MKRFALPLAAFALFAFAACDDNKPNENPTEPLAEKIAGTYNGYSYSKSVMQAYPWTAEDEVITITANSDNTASLTFDSKGEWGSYSVENLSIETKDNYYTVSGSGKVSLGMSPEQSGEYNFTITGTIKSTVDATFVIVASVGAMGDVITTFVTGTMPDALKITGKYEGYTKANSLMFKDKITADQALTINANADGTVNLDFTSETWGIYSLENLVVGNSSGVYTIEGAGKVLLGMSPEQSSEYDYTMEGSIKSVDDANITFIVALGGMGETTVEFITGDAPAIE